MQRITTGLALIALSEAISLKADSESISTSLEDLLSGFINRNEKLFKEDPQSDEDDSDIEASGQEGEDD